MDTHQDGSQQYRGTSFSSLVQGQDASVIDLTLGRIAKDVYENEGSVIDGWRPLNENELTTAGIDPKLLSDERTGFAARIYTDDHGHHIVAFRGTDEAKDWRHNFRQGLGLEDAQYNQARDLAKAAHDSFGEELVFTGHSLGGGLATVGALVTRLPAVTYNSSGINDETLERLKIRPDYAAQVAEEGLIRRYAVENEILTSAQEEYLLTRRLLPDAVGHKVELPDPHPEHGWKQIIPGHSLRHGLQLHGMDSVMEAQQLAAQGLMTNPAHPANGMFNDAVAGLKGIKPEALGFHSEEEYRNAAGSLVAKAREAGMQRIDHVVIGANGALFAVEGPLQDASHRIASVDKTQAASQSIEASSQQLHSLAQPQAQLPVQPTEDVQRRAALLP